MKNLVTLLRKKLEAPKTPQMDRKFWARFNQEFGGASRPPFWDWLKAPRIFIPASSLALCVLAFAVFSRTLPRKTPNLTAPIELAESLSQDSELLQDLDAYEVFDELTAEATDPAELDAWWDVLANAGDAS